MTRDHHQPTHSRVITASWSCGLWRVLADSAAVKSKPDGLIVIYTRVTTKEHARLSKIAKRRGRPHTLASVTAEMISKSLQQEKSQKDKDS